MILVFAAIFSYIYFSIERNKVPLYVANGTMYVTNATDVAKYYYSTSDTYNSQALIKTCGVIIKSTKVVERIKAELDENYELPRPYSVAEIKAAISVTSVDETEVMQISITTASKEASVSMCNAVIKVIPSAIDDVIGAGTAKAMDEASGNIVHKTNLPSFKAPAIWGGVGALLVALISVMIYLLDTRIKSKEEITQNYSLPVLGEIPNFQKKYANERYKSYYDKKY